MRSNIVKDSFLILITNGLTYIASIINTRIISEYLSLADYGYRAQILTVVAIAVAVFSLGFSNAPNYFIPIYEGKHSCPKIVRNLYFIATIICLVMSIVLIGGYKYIVDYYHNDNLVTYRIIVVVMAVEQIYYSFYSGIQISQHKAIKATITNFLRCITTVIVTIIICRSEGSLFQILLYTLLVDSSFCVFTIIDSSKPLTKGKDWINIPLLKEMAVYCIPLGISTITASLCSQIDKLFVGRLYSPDDLAIYSNMCTELPLAAISGAFIAVISPYVVKMIGKGNSRDAIDLWKRIVEIVAILLLPIIAMLFVFSKQAISILYSDKYLSGFHLFQVFVLVELARITYFGLILRSYGKSMLILLSSAAALGLNIILNLISYYVLNAGLFGFAVSTILATYLVQLFQLLLSSQIASVSFKDIFPWNNLLLLLIINILFAFIIWLVVSRLKLADKTDIDALYKLTPIILIWVISYGLLLKRRFIELYRSVKQLSNI